MCYNNNRVNEFMKDYPFNLKEICFYLILAIPLVVLGGIYFTNIIKNQHKNDYDLIDKYTINNNISLSCNLNDITKCFCDNITLSEFNNDKFLIISDYCTTFFNNINNDINNIKIHIDNDITTFQALYIVFMILFGTGCIAGILHMILKLIIFYNLWKYCHCLRKYKEISSNTNDTNLFSEISQSIN